MQIKYTGGRSRYLISFNRKPYHFTPENNHILDIQEKEVINYIFSLNNRTEFEVVMEQIKEEPKIIPKVEENIIPEKEKSIKKEKKYATRKKHK